MFNNTLIENLFNPDILLGAVFYAVLISIITIIILRIAKRFTHKLIGRSQRLAKDKTAVVFITQLVQVLVMILAAVIYFQLIPSLRAIGTAVIATAGIASIILGLAAQNTLGNIISGISILVYRPVRLGDNVKVYASAGDETGVVESITLGYTTLLMADGEKIIVPNSVLASTVIVNYGKKETHDASLHDSNIVGD
jgi:small-conductance mechanosensitive channel